jgi:hypothetical protein
MNICKEHCKLSKCPILNKDQCPVVILLTRAEDAKKAMIPLGDINLN